MVYQGGEYSFKELLGEIKTRAKESAVQSDYEYVDLVEEVVEEKKNEGFFSEDEDLEQLKNDLKLVWPEVEKFLRE
jgi:hypothetical protein